MITIGIGPSSIFLKAVLIFLLFQFIQSLLELFILVNGRKKLTVFFIILFWLFLFCSGTHYKGKNCNPERMVNLLSNSYTHNKKSFFPNSLTFSKVDVGIRALKKSNGGWSDRRDHQLCKSFLGSTLNITTIQIIN